MTDQETRPKYGYTEEFQVQIAALIIRDNIMMSEYENVIDPSYFDYDDLTHLVEISRNHFYKHQEMPTRASLSQGADDYCRRYRLPKQNLQQLLNRIQQIYQDKVLLNAESVKERICRFATRQALKKATIEIVDLVESDNGLDRAREIVERALQTGSDTNSMGFDFFNNIDKIPEMVRTNSAGKIRTDFPIFDEKTGGGPCRGDVWCVMGESGGGKSQFLINIAIAAIRQGIVVIHITIGDLKESEVTQRYMSRLTRCTEEQIRDETPEYLIRARKVNPFKNRYLRIKHYYSGSLTCPNIRTYISRITTIDGVKPGMLILDYADECKKSGKSDYEDMGEIYSELKKLAEQYEMVVWTGSQINRWTPKFKYDVIKKINIADSAKKVQKADGLVSINYLREDDGTEIYRLWIDKSRKGKDKFMVPLEVDLATSFIKQGRFKNKNGDESENG